MKHILLVVAVVACMGTPADHHEIDVAVAKKTGIVKPRLVNEHTFQRECFGDEEATVYYHKLQNAVAGGEATEHEAMQKLKWMKENLCSESGVKDWLDAEDEWIDIRELGLDGCERFGIIVHDGIPQVIEKDGHIFTFDLESRSYHAIGFRPPVE